jgi:PAS domain S-box-containing protein
MTRVTARISVRLRSGQWQVSLQQLQCHARRRAGGVSLERSPLVRQLENDSARLIAAQAVARVGSWETDLSTFAVIWSDETHRIFETSPETFRPTHAAFLELIHPDDRVAVDAAFIRSVGQPGAQSIEHRLLMPDGRIKFVEERWRTFSDEQDRPVRAAGTCQDITERNLFEEALRESNQNFRQLSDNITDAFWIRSADMREIHFISAAFEKIWGRTVESLYANPQEWTDFILPEDRDRVRIAFARLTTEPTELDIEYRIVRPEGEVRWVRVRGYQVRDGAGSLIRHTGIVTDITESKRASLEIASTHRALTMLSGCNEALIRAIGEPELLNEVCGIIVGIGGYRMAWVGERQDDEARSIAPLAHAGVENGFLSEVKGSWQEHDALGHGPSGQAIRTGQVVVCEDLARRYKASPWFASTESRGYRGLICLPLRDPSRTFGLLTLYSADVHEINTGELKLLQEMADNLAFGMSNLRAQSDQRRLQAALVKVAVSVSAAAGSEFFQQLARNMAEALGAHAAFIAQLLPGEPLTARTVAAIVDGEVMDNTDYLLEGTPSEGLFLTSDLCVVESSITGQFPDSPFVASVGGQGYVGRRLSGSLGQPLGILFVVFTQPLKNVEFITSTLQIFAARAASELERQHAETQVREQAALLDIAHEAIQVRELDGRIIYWNKGAEHMYGWTAAEVLGRSAVEMFYTDAARFRAALTALVARGTWQGEVITRTKDGRDITVEVRWTLVRDANGGPKSVLAIDTDITEKKRLESQFLRAQRMESIGTLAGGIAHDLNNVLAPILMSVELLGELARDDNDRALLATLHGNAQRGADLVKQVLSFARGVEGERILVNPLHLMRDLLKVMGDTLPKSIGVRFSPAPDLWTVTGDPTQMHQVFLNLFINARDAMPDGGQLTVKMANVLLDATDVRGVRDGRPGAFVMLTVQDTGAGIPLEIRDKIFEPFFTTKEIGKGTGLGLSTALAIVKSHRGFIQIDSEPGTGTAFNVYLPAQTTEAATKHVAPPPVPLPHGHGELVLVVDDEEGIRAIAKRTLERYGYGVMLACQGAEAVSLYTQHRADIAVVLTDMMMPIMDGPALIIALKAINPHVRIIGTSGLTSRSGVDKALGEAVEHFLPKPYTAHTLLNLLRKVLADDPQALVGSQITM